MSSINESNRNNFVTFRSGFTLENIVDIMGFVTKKSGVTLGAYFIYQFGKESVTDLFFDKQPYFYMNGLDCHLSRSFLGLLENLLIFDIRRFLSILVVEK